MTITPLSQMKNMFHGKVKEVAQSEIMLKGKQQIADLLVQAVD